MKPTTQNAAGAGTRPTAAGFITPGTPGNHWGNLAPHRPARAERLLRGRAVTGYITD
jgi:hypothetical protein